MKLVTIILLWSLLSSFASATTDLTYNAELGGILEALSDEKFPTNTYATDSVCAASEEWPGCLTRVNFQNEKSKAMYRKHAPRLQSEFKAKGLEWGAPIFIRSFKHPGVQKDPDSKLSATRQLAQNWSEGRIEVWVEKPDRNYKLFKTYPVCALPGKPGPKWIEGDETTPEGFYELGPGQLNPKSKYHLSFNMGYPNAYDVACHSNPDQGIGGEIMVHGDCVSAGCLAMTNPVIEELYTIVDTSMSSNISVGPDGKAQAYKIPFHSFPFPMTTENLSALDPEDLSGLSKHITGSSGDKLDLNSYWGNLKEGYDFFEKAKEKKVPDVTVVGKTANTKYIFTEKKNKIVKRRCI